MISGATSLGQMAAGYLVDLGVMLYLTFFLLRDGPRIVASAKLTLPMPHEISSELMSELVNVTRATLTSSFVIAALQGTMGASPSPCWASARRCCGAPRWVSCR
jgi:predicted PurR-regulated permease PerM